MQRPTTNCVVEFVGVEDVFFTERIFCVNVRVVSGWCDVVRLRVTLSNHQRVIQPPAIKFCGYDGAEPNTKDYFDIKVKSDGNATTTIKFCEVSSKYGGLFKLDAEPLNHNYTNDSSLSNPIVSSHAQSKEIKILCYRVKCAQKPKGLKPTDSLAKLKGIGKQYSEKLSEIGYHSYRDLAQLFGNDMLIREVLCHVRKARGQMTNDKFVALIEQAKKVCQCGENEQQQPVDESAPSFSVGPTVGALTESPIFEAYSASAISIDGVPFSPSPACGVAVQNHTLSCVGSFAGLFSFDASCTHAVSSVPISTATVSVPTPIAFCNLNAPPAPIPTLCASGSSPPALSYLQPTAATTSTTPGCDWAGHSADDCSFHPHPHTATFVPFSMPGPVVHIKQVECYSPRAAADDQPLNLEHMGNDDVCFGTGNECVDEGDHATTLHQSIFWTEDLCSHLPFGGHIERGDIDQFLSISSTDVPLAVEFDQP